MRDMPEWSPQLSNAGKTSVTNTFGSLMEMPFKIFPFTLPKAVQPARIRVVIFGLHSLDWMSALSPESPVWRGIPRVESVIVVPDSPVPEIPSSMSGIPYTVLIPLMESHTRNRPKTLPSLAPDERSLDAFGDKGQFQAYVRDNGLAHLCPEHFSSPATARFPCILKRTDLNAAQA